MPLKKLEGMKQARNKGEEEMIEDIDLKFRWYKHRFFVIIKINALLKVARRLAKDNQKERAKTFIDSATEIIEAYALW